MATPTFAPIPQYNIPQLEPLPGYTNPTLPEVPKYNAPTFNFGDASAGNILTDPLEANIKAAPSLEKIADILNRINQKAWMSAPGRQQQLETIQQWQAGALDPQVYEQARMDAAQQWGGAGFGVDSPAWQASVQRALGLKRQGLQEKGMAAMQDFYSGMPTTDVSKYMVTPQDYAAALDAAQRRELAAAELTQKGELTMAELAQRRAQAEAELAQKGQLTTAELAQQRALANQELSYKQAQLSEQARLQQEELGERARSQTQAEAAAAALEQERLRAAAEQTQASQFAELFGKYYTPTRFSGVGYDPRTTEGRRMQDYFYGQDALARQRALRAATMATGYYSPSMFQSGAYPTMRALS